MYAAWNHPRTLSIISKIAQADLIPAINIEIGNINISVQNPDAGEVPKNGTSDDIPVTKWHYDSYPFVCVVMMSDASNMVGGETAVKSGSGEIMKVRGPQMVSLSSIFRYNYMKILTHLGVCSGPPRPMYLASSACSSRRCRTHHNGYRVSAP